MIKVNQYISVIGIILATSAICYAMSGLMGYRVVAFILLLVVSLLAITMDIIPVMLAAVLSAFIWDFFFIPPRYTIHVDTTEDLILLVMYFVVAIISGVLTFRIRLVEKVARTKEERANSVKLYNTILNSLSHELRTPIATIIGASDNIRSNFNLSDAERIQLIDEISNASLRLNQQVENLLNLSRLESGHIRPKMDWTDIVELVHETVHRVETNNPGRRINISINQNLPVCSIDKVMLEQVLYNLLNNAAVHTATDSIIEIVAYCHGTILEFMVEDSGAIDKNAIEKVINKFSRDSPPNSSGSGLGLSIAKGFTEALGGHIHLKKNAYGGASFTVIIPVRTTELVSDEQV